MARIDGSQSVGSSQSPLSPQQIVVNESELKLNDSIGCSDIPQKNESNGEIATDIKCSEEQNSLNNCTDSESVKSKWPANQLEDIENKTDILSDTAISGFGSTPNGEEDIVSMEVEAEYNYLEKNSVSSGVESMEVDGVEKRESLKRQRETCLSTEANESDPISLSSLNSSEKPSFDESMVQMISRIFSVNWTDCESSAFKLQLEPLVVSNNYINLVQNILMETISQLINSFDFENALEIYERLKQKIKSNENDFIETNELTFPKELFKSKEKSVLVFCYLLECFERLSHEEKSLSFRNSSRFNQILTKMRLQIIEFCVLVLNNSLVISPLSSNSNSILAQLLLSQSLPSNFMSSLVCSTYQIDIENNSITFKTIFTPILQFLWQEMQSTGSLVNESSHKLPLRALNELCLITYKEKSVRPVCQLVCFLV